MFLKKGRNNIKLIGIKSHKLYAKGPTKADLLRQVQHDYPSFQKPTKWTDKHGIANTPVLPEAMMIIRIESKSVVRREAELKAELHKYRSN
ncbi:hypothetical protein YK48G_04210 [Lentilactobacillus fungorum]|uniref:Uncharacterized protein n=1 Tax=Lentilactobacillus fungorum TaxID=2201250 RepID=A0ABQ3VX47_9LACO|nr:hypothetical protein YK48G_04210 [Lentilactobacillus fungorum]